MTKILIIGLGGVGTAAAYQLQEFNEDVEVTALVRSDYERVVDKGYTLNFLACDAKEAKEVQVKPTHIVKSLEEVAEIGPFDHIVISIKVLPKPSNNLWDLMYDMRHSLIQEGGITNIVLLQNGVDIEKYWAKFEHVNLISGISYISSTNKTGTVTMFAPDEVSFGLFLKSGNEEKLKEFVGLYSNDYNKVTIDSTTRYSRMRKLLYNAAFNTVCCLTNSGVGLMYDIPGLVDNIFRPLMKEIQLVANQDLEDFGLSKIIEDSDIENMINMTKEFDAPSNYAPSMLVDFRNNRPIELEVILGNLIEIYKKNNANDIKLKLHIPYLTFLYHSLTVIQHNLQK